MPIAKIALILSWFAVLALAERVAPATPRPRDGGRARLWRNLGFLVTNTLMNPLIIVPISVAAASLQVWSRPAWPLWPQLALDLVLLDLWVYAWHRANHEWQLLWRFHRVHHLDRFLDTSSAVRFHPGEVLISALARAPLIVLADIPLTSLALFDTLVLLGALFHHSNLRLAPGFEAVLRWLVVTPSHHWVHHHVGADTNSNYATLLTLWDRVFASWSKTERSPAMEIGLGAPDESLPSLAALPFRMAPAPPGA